MTRVLTIRNLFLLLCLSGCADYGPDFTTAALTSAPATTGLTGPDSAAARLGMSREAVRVGQIAVRDGDRDFLMLDKAQGRIFAFEDGRPTFSGAALSGENPVDTLAPDAFDKTFAEQKGLKYKVTPAGRYTVSIGYDPHYGETLDVNEVQGKDWDIAIHRVWLGAPAEHRDARLRSPRTDDKHITYGCIDVDEPTMQGLLDRVPDDEHTPLYILPQNADLVSRLFERREARRGGQPSG